MGAPIATYVVLDSQGRYHLLAVHTGEQLVQASNRAAVATWATEHGCLIEWDEETGVHRGARH